MRAILWVRKSARAVESTLLLLALFSIIGFTVLQIVVRNLNALLLTLNAKFESINIAYNFPVFSWTESLNQHLVLVIAFLGAMVAGRKGEHIAFDLFQQFVPSKIKYHLALVGSIISGGICFYLAYVCSLLTYENSLDDSPYIVFANIPQWAFEIVIPLGFAVMGYRLIKVGIHSLYHRHIIEKNKAIF